MLLAALMLAQLGAGHLYQSADAGMAAEPAAAFANEADCGYNGACRRGVCAGSCLFSVSASDWHQPSTYRWGRAVQSNNIFPQLVAENRTCEIEDPTPSFSFTGGAQQTPWRRERPHVLLDDDGSTVAALSTAVQLGKPDVTWTLVQEVQLDSLLREKMPTHREREVNAGLHSVRRAQQPRRQIGFHTTAAHRNAHRVLAGVGRRHARRDGGAVAGTDHV